MKSRTVKAESANKGGKQFKNKNIEEVIFHCSVPGGNHRFPERKQGKGWKTGNVSLDCTLESVKQRTPKASWDELIYGENISLYLYKLNSLVNKDIS